jgi:hypothetical protein
MFFPEKIRSIAPNDKVLEIGPGADPNSRSDILLEKRYSTEKEYFSQLGKEEHIKTNKTIVYYDGETMPFNDDEFDYVICSHVLEHIADIESFIKEVMRIGKKGYFEFPTIYYDYIYNFDVHKTLLFYSDNRLIWLPKESTPLNQFKIVNDFFLLTLNNGYVDYINKFKDYFFLGFEWDRSITIKKAEDLRELCFELSSLSIPFELSKDYSFSRQANELLHRAYQGFKNRIKLFQ